MTKSVRFSLLYYN